MAKKSRTISESLLALDRASSDELKNLRNHLKGEWIKMDANFESAVQEIAEETKKKLNSLRDKTIESSKHAIQAVDEYAQKDPWVVIGIFALIAAFLGSLFGFLIGRTTQR